MSLAGYAQKPSDTSVYQMEKLDRGLIVFPTTAGKCFVSWRLLGTDDNNTTFEILKNGQSLQKGIYKTTSASVTGTKDDMFQVVTYQNGIAQYTTPEVKPWDKAYLTIPLNRPGKGQRKKLLSQRLLGG